MKKKDENNTKDKPKKKGFFTPVKIIVLIMVLAIAGGGGFAGYKFFLSSGYPGKKMEQVTLPEDLLKFAFRHLPETYNGLVTINNEIILIEREIGRIDQIEKEFPQQKKITDSERKRWVKTNDKLKGFLTKLEFKIESLYVAFRVNKSKGEELIKTKREELAASIKGALEPAQEMTGRLKPKEEDKKGFVDKIKGLIGK